MIDSESFQVEVVEMSDTKQIVDFQPIKYLYDDIGLHVAVVGQNSVAPEPEPYEVPSSCISTYTGYVSDSDFINA